jgi:hypothetical protein
LAIRATRILASKLPIQPPEHPHPRQRAIVIGQAAEFDYSRTQTVRALREEGYRVILVNSNPARGDVPSHLAQHLLGRGRQHPCT